MFNDIKQSYTGGAMDMYLPVKDGSTNVKIYQYDVNSLYPTVMLTEDIPVGHPIYFEGAAIAALNKAGKA